MDHRADNRQIGAAVLTLFGLIAAGVLYASASDLRRAAGQNRTIDLEYASDTPTEDVRNVEVYISGYIDNPLRNLLAVHPRFDLVAKVRPDEHGRVSVRVPYYSNYRVDVFLPRKDWGDPRGIQVYADYLYGPGGASDRRARATLELETARTFEYR